MADDADHSASSDSLTASDDRSSTPSPASRRRRSLSRSPSPGPNSQPYHSPQSSGAYIVGRVDRLTSSLMDTNRNLRNVDKMLERLNDREDTREEILNKLRDNLTKSHDLLRQERGQQTAQRPLRSASYDYSPSPSRGGPAPVGRRSPTSPLREYRDQPGVSGGGGDREFTAVRGTSPSRVGRGNNQSMEFIEIPHEGQMHEVHQGLRDLGSHTRRLNQDMNREIDQRQRSDIDMRTVLSQLLETLQQSQLQSPPPPSPSTHTNHQPDQVPISQIEETLRQIQDDLKVDRMRPSREVDLSNVISAELKKALDEQSKPANTPDTESDLLKRRLSQAENAVRELDEHLHKSRRQVDQSEGAKEAMMRQLDDMRSELERAVDEKNHVKQRMSDIIDQMEKDSMRKGEKHAEERKKLQDDVKKLREELSSPARYNEINDLKNSLDRSERQQAHLADALESMSQEGRDKDHQYEQLLIKLKDMTDKYEESEKQRHKLIAKLDGTLKSMDDVNRETSRYSERLRTTEQLIQDAEKRRNSLKTKAQDQIKNWKGKCKRLDQELASVKKENYGLTAKTDELTKYIDAFKSHGSSGAHQLESLAKEMYDVLAARAEQDEVIRRKNDEVMEAKCSTEELQREIGTLKDCMEKLEAELHIYRSKLASITDEKLNAEEELAAITTRYNLMQEEQKYQQHQAKDANSHLSDMSHRVSHEMSQKEEMRNRMIAAESREKVAREELASLLGQMKDNEESHIRLVNDLKREMQMHIASGDRQLHEMVVKLKKERAEMEAEIQTLKLELAEDRATTKTLRHQRDGDELQVQKLREHIEHLEEQQQDVDERYNKIKKDYTDKSRVIEDLSNKLNKFEAALRSAKEKFKRLDDDLQAIIANIGQEVDSFVDLVSRESAEKFRALSPIRGVLSEPQAWLGEMKSKLKWLQTEIEERQDRERRLKQRVYKKELDIRSAIESSDNDRSILLSEMKKLKNVNQLLNKDVDDLDSSNRDKSETIATLHNHVNNLDKQLKASTHALALSASLLTPDNDTIIDSLREIKQAHNEKVVLDEQYSSYRSQVDTLQKQLEDAKRVARECQDELDSSIQNDYTHDIKTHKKMTKICHTPPTMLKPTSPSPTPDIFLNGSKYPAFDSNKISSFTPEKHHLNSKDSSQPQVDPINMTDEEFREMFMPKSPVFPIEAERDDH